MNDIHFVEVLFKYKGDVVCHHYGYEENELCSTVINIQLAKNIVKQMYKIKSEDIIKFTIIDNFETLEDEKDKNKNGTI